MRNTILLVLALGAVLSCRRDPGPLDTDTGVILPTDDDRDGSPSDLDCDDANAAVFPGAEELCDGVDGDCDGTVDEDATDRATFYGDGDGDGHGDLAVAVEGCDAPTGFAASSDDCDDSDADVHPGAEESDCTDRVDYNCDGSVGFDDADEDGTPACKDCDDDEALVHPGQHEVCNGVDDDCDGTTDAAGAIGADTWYTDADLDGFGDEATATVACTAPTDAVDVAGDCDDADATVNPDGSEVCDDVDQDCDGDVDEGASDPATWYADGDGDGHGAKLGAVVGCDAPTGFVAAPDDCDDGDAATFPGATEDCDVNVDRNCDGSIGYVDADADGTPACKDCDDADATERPGAVEICDGDDDDCDSFVDEAGATGELTFYADVDGDGAGDNSSTTKACALPTGFVANATDCNDASGTVAPGAPETCDGVDQDCDGNVDEGATDTKAFYVDADGDGVGGGTSVQACAAPAGFVATSGDCLDGDSTAFPGATEACNGRDDDCAGGVPANEADVDGDGSRVCGGDCDDADRTIAPNAAEVCDGLDNDCVGGVPANESDADGDKMRVCAGDCDDTSGVIYLGAVEICDGLDDDCSNGVPSTETDDDGDSQSECKGDCNDGSKVAYTGAVEVFYDGIDGDCKGGDDWDADGDGFASAVLGKGTDLNDGNAAIGAAGSNLASAVDDCAALKALIPTTTTGLYFIDPGLDGAPFQAYCDMTTAGGGWTLISNRRANTVNVESCGATLAAFFDGCGAATAIAATDSYAMLRAERAKLLATELLNVQYLAGVADTDDAYIVRYTTPGTELLPNTAALVHVPLVRACDINNANCDTTNVWWKYIGDYWYHSSQCLADSSFNATYRGNYGLCVNGANNTDNSTYNSSNGFGNRDQYDETKLWAHPNNAAAYQERLFYR